MRGVVGGGGSSVGEVAMGDASGELDVSLVVTDLSCVSTFIFSLLEDLGEKRLLGFSSKKHVLGTLKTRGLSPARMRLMKLKEPCVHSTAWEPPAREVACVAEGAMLTPEPGGCVH